MEEIEKHDEERQIVPVKDTETFSEKMWRNGGRWLSFGAGAYLLCFTMYQVTTQNTTALEASELIGAAIGLLSFASRGKNEKS